MTAIERTIVSSDYVLYSRKTYLGGKLKSKLINASHDAWEIKENRTKINTRKKIVFCGRGEEGDNLAATK